MQECNARKFPNQAGEFKYEYHKGCTIDCQGYKSDTGSTRRYLGKGDFMKLYGALTIAFVIGALTIAFV